MPDLEFQPAWITTAGYIDPTSHAPLGSAAASGFEVLNAVNRYCWAYDERSWAELEALFDEDATWRYSVAGAEQPLLENRAAIFEWLQGHMDSQSDQRRHCALNPVVQQLTESSARVIVYLVLTSAQDGQVELTTTGAYQFELANTAGAWRITSVFSGFDAAF